MILSISAVSAEGFNSSVQSQEIVVATPNGVQNAKIEFIDKTKINNGWKISPYGGDRRVYRHSYSQIAKNTITAYNVGPREKDVFLLSVSKGQEKTISSTKKVTGSVQFSTNVGVEIKSLINMAIPVILQEAFLMNGRNQLNIKVPMEIILLGTIMVQ